MKALSVAIFLAIGFFTQSFLDFTPEFQIYPVYDTHENKLPVHFRSGELRASGSGQFSEQNFSPMMESLAVPREKIIVIDLRQESHGFINGKPVSWTDGKYNYGNLFKSKREVEADEFQRLVSASRAKRLIIDRKGKSANVIVKSIKTEKEVVENQGCCYLRLPVTDRNRPSNEVVDQFIEFIRKVPEDHWMHFHCKMGKGRTTTFLTLFDIIKNGKEADFQTIIARQKKIGGVDLSTFQRPDFEKARASRARFDFIQSFYHYRREVPDFSIKWSEWTERKSPHQLSIEEKVGQLLMVHFHGKEVNEEAKRLIEELHVGGIIYYSWANGLTDPKQVAALSRDLQKMSHPLPLLIGVDQEGGVVNRLKRGSTLFPSPYALGLTGKYSWGKEAAKVIGKELNAVGIGINFAPVADVFTNRDNPVIGIRSFSSDPEQVAIWTSLFLEGFREEGVIGTLKHFPGHGDSATDSHITLPVIKKTREELDRCELLPYRFNANKAGAIMTAHLMVPSLDAEHCATFSKKIVEDLLRKELNFQGVVITDSFAMEGILAQAPSLEEGVLRSIEAGHDLVLLGGKQLLSTQKGFEFTVDDIVRVHRYLVQAVQSGRLSEKRIDESVSRIISLKKREGVEKTTLEQVGRPESLALSSKIAKKALHLAKGGQLLPLSIQKEPIALIVPEFLKEELEETSWGHLGSMAKIITFNQKDENVSIGEEFKNCSTCIFFASQMKQFPAQQKLLAQLRHRFPVLFVIAVRDPVDGDFLSSADGLLFTYGFAPSSLQAAFNYLIFYFN